MWVETETHSRFSLRNLLEPNAALCFYCRESNQKCSWARLMSNKTHRAPVTAQLNPLSVLNVTHCTLCSVLPHWFFITLEKKTKQKITNTILNLFNNSHASSAKMSSSLCLLAPVIIIWFVPGLTRCIFNSRIPPYLFPPTQDQYLLDWYSSSSALLPAPDICSKYISHHAFFMPKY